MLRLKWKHWIKFYEENSCYILGFLMLSNLKWFSIFIHKTIVDLIEDMEDTYLATERLENPQKLWKQEDLEQDLDLEH